MTKVQIPILLRGTDLSLTRGGRQLFSGLTVDLLFQGILLVTGPNGIGKSSLLQVMAGLLQPDTGTIGWPISTAEVLGLHYLGLDAGVKTRLTVAENLEFWRRVNGPTGLSVEAALERVGLGDLGGLDAGHLSAGQTRRLALARLLVTHRRVWLLDEPTTALDSEGKQLVGQLMVEHAMFSGGSVMAATHEPIPEAAGAVLTKLDLGAPAARAA